MNSPRPARRRATAVTVWAVAGVLALLIRAVIGLGGRGLATIRAGLEPLEMAALLLVTVAFFYTEGVRALQKRWVPHVIRRIDDLRRRSGTFHAVLAPLFAMSLVGAPRQSMARAWLGVAAIVLAVVLVRAVPEPWRGIVDVAVALALAWGCAALLIQAVRAFR